MQAYESANGQLSALKQQQVADRNELSATRERLRQSEETARIAQAVCDRVRVEASDEHGATPRDPGNKCLISRDLTVCGCLLVQFLYLLLL